MIQPSSAISLWLDRFFESYYRSNPVTATFIGAHEGDHLLPDYSDGGVAATKTRIDDLLRDSASLSLDVLSPSEHIDLRLAQGALRIQQWELQGDHFHRGNPSLYTGEAIFGVISLFLNDYAPLPERIAAATERLEGVPRLLAQARKNLQAAPSPWTERAIRECEGARALLGQGLPQLEDGVPMQVASFAAATAVAIDAFSDFRGYLETELRHRVAGKVACGEEALGLHLAEGHFLGQDAEEIVRYATAELAEVETDLAARAADFGAASPAEVLAQLKQRRPSRESYENRYQEVWDEARRVAIGNNLVTWPDLPIRYRPRPQWLRSAAPYLYFLFYRSPAVLRRPPIHEYFVMPQDGSASAEDQQHFLEAHNDSVIKLNHVIHHGGLGHHLQNYHAFRAASRVGRMAAVDGASRIALPCGGTMAEGWACYATDLMAETGFLTPLERYAERQGRARMCARAIVDVRLHQGRFTLQEAARFYEAQALLPPAAAMAEAVKNSMFPGTAVIYLMGRDAIHNLRRDLQALQGHTFSLPGFHDRFLAFGSIPVSLIARAMKQGAANAAQ